MTAVATSLNPSERRAEHYVHGVCAGGDAESHGDSDVRGWRQPLGTAILDATGNASFSTAALGSGSYTITAVYGGDSSSLGSASRIFMLTVNAA